MQRYSIYIFTILFVLLTHVAYAAEKITYETKEQNDVNKESFYTIEIKYPVFKNGATVDNLNRIINQKIENMVADFKKNIENRELADGPKLTVESNTLTSKYKIFTENEKLISLRFENSRYFYATAHPNTDFITLNYDIEQGKLLTLSDFFKSHSNYLEVIANYSRKELTKKLSKMDSSYVKPEEEGVAPKAKNYELWNITPNGLLITFPAYQVAAYAFGPLEVKIPYSAMKEILREDFMMLAE